MQAKLQWGIISHCSEWPSLKYFKYQMQERVWRRRNPCTLLVGMQIGTATMENPTDIPQNTKNRITIWSGNLTPGHTPDKITIQRYTCTPVFKAALFTRAKNGNNLQCPMTHEQIKKMWYAYMQWNTMQAQEIRESYHLRQLDKPWGHYAK